MSCQVLEESQEELEQAETPSTTRTKFQEENLVRVRRQMDRQDQRCRDQYQEVEVVGPNSAVATCLVASMAMKRRSIGVERGLATVVEEDAAEGFAIAAVEVVH